MKTTWLIAFWLLLVSVSTLLEPDFLTIRIVNGRFFGSLIDILHHSAPAILVSLSMALVIGTGNIDLSVGAIIAIAGSVTAVLAAYSQLSPYLILACSLGVGLICGLWNALLVAVLGLPSFVATLILMVSGRGIAQIITDGQVVTFDSDFINGLGNGHLWGIPSRVLIMGAFVLFMVVFIRKTALGLFIEAIGANTRASYLAGVNTLGIVVFVYLFSGVSAALSGVLLAADIQGADAANMGLWIELDAILAVVMAGASLFGGRMSLLGAVMGVLIIQTLTSMLLISGFPAQYSLVIKALVVITLIIAQSESVGQKLSRLLPRQLSRRWCPQKPREEL
ncbi:ABC transporter permease [Hahella ganghwensis]|uniref:ABC transporter permease n=1 Tax=Hahella ganghwensis TaxID=286420 RepID=UPI000373F7A4|nr:ABC transporter permease [Hahella ganghwensis]